MHFFLHQPTAPLLIFLVLGAATEDATLRLGACVLSNNGASPELTSSCSLPGVAPLAVILQSTVPAEQTLTTLHGPAEGLHSAFVTWAEQHWRMAPGPDGCRSPYFEWERVFPIDGTPNSLVSVCFNNSFAEWTEGQTGQGYTLPGQSMEEADALFSKLNAYWRIAVPSSGLSYQATGIARALMPGVMYLNRDGTNRTSGGLHYKRTANGEHFPWWNLDGSLEGQGVGENSTMGTYFCTNAAVCGYEGVPCGYNPCDDTLYHRIVLRPFGVSPSLPLPA